MFKTAEGLKYYDLVEGKGPKAEKGLTVQVRFHIKLPAYLFRWQMFSSQMKMQTTSLYADPCSFRYTSTASFEGSQQFLVVNLNF